MVKTPSIMKGYYRDEKLTKNTICEGWLNTRDLGYKDENNYLYVVSRMDDMIIKGGMNIYPREIENEILKLSEVEEVIAYGARQGNGEVIAVDVVLSKSGNNLEMKEMVKKISEILPTYLIPTIVNIKSCLEKNASGKIKRPQKNYMIN